MSYIIHHFVIPFEAQESISDLIFSGFFTTLGAAIPLFMLLLLAFYRNYIFLQKNIRTEEELLNKYKDALSQEEENLDFLNSKIVSNEITMNSEIFILQNGLQQNIFEYKLTIISKESWIKRIKSKNFFNWVFGHLSRKYFKDYLQQK
jgi:hypothetical protein